MATAVNTLIDNVEALLLDSSNARWSAADLIIYLNLAQAEVCRHKPDASVTMSSTKLVAESVQSIPTDGTKLIKIVRYMGTDGSTLGDAIQLIDMDLLDKRIPAWHETTATAQPTYYMYDPLNPKKFWVYPKNTGTGYVNILYNSIPATVAAGANIGLGDEYVVPIMYFILHMAYLRDADVSPNNANIALAYQQAFLTALIAAESKEETQDPNVAQTSVSRK